MNDCRYHPTYNGWRNYQTWNVSLWISNSEPLYLAALAYVDRTADPTYDEFLETLRYESGELTPDKVSWSDPTIDHDALTHFLIDLAR